MNNLFKKVETKLHSGEISDFKIECDALTDEDLECLAYLISKRIKFGAVIGVPKGGTRLQKALEKYDLPDNDTLLICDDVFTTGKSIKDLKKQIGINDVEGVVIFSRGKCPKWITPLFQMNLISPQIIPEENKRTKGIPQSDIDYFNKVWKERKK